MHEYSIQIDLWSKWTIEYMYRSENDTSTGYAAPVKEASE